MRSELNLSSACMYDYTGLLKRSGTIFTKLLLPQLVANEAQTRLLSSPHRAGFLNMVN
jgi:hypothetical protein